MSATTRESADHLIEHVSGEIEFLQRLLEDLATLKETRQWGHPWAADRTSQTCQGKPGPLVAAAELEIERVRRESLTSLHKTNRRAWIERRLEQIDLGMSQLKGSESAVSFIVEREKLEGELKELVAHPPTSEALRGAGESHE